MGAEVAERYELVEPLGRGGMGTVWRARDQKLGRQVALKEVQFPTYVPEGERRSLRERVLQEARAAARLSHPGVVTVFDVFEEDDKTFIAMELVEWPSLADMVQEEGPLAPATVAQIGTELLQTIAEAHAKGIVHRDVKPGNVMVGPAGRVKLTDFGIASVKGGPHLTVTGAIIGSPSYMSPEQARGEAAEPATDLWALGATMYFAVTGRAPFERGEALPTLNAILTEDPEPIEGDLGEVIMTLLSKEPGARPAPDQLRPMLERAAKVAQPGPVGQTVPMEAGDGLREGSGAASPTHDAAPPVPAPAAADTIGLGEARPTAVVSTPAGDSPTVQAQRKRSRAWLYLAGAVVAVAVIGLALAFMPQPERSQDRQPATSGQPIERQTQQVNRDEDEGSGGTDVSSPVTAAGAGRRFSVGDTGYEIRYPPSWRVVRNPIGDGSSVRFQDRRGRYLLLDWTDQPGDDAAAAWRSQAQSFAQRHQNYREIRIEPTTFQDFKTAAIWEYAYTEGGASLHAIDLGFANDDWGFALNFQTPEADWEESQATFEQFKDSFRRER